MIAKKGTFVLGSGMLIGFLVVLVAIFMPFFDGKNGLEYLDALYNSIAKGSANFMEKVRHEIEPLSGKQIDVTLSMGSDTLAKQAAGMFRKTGGLVKISGSQVNVGGDLGKILAAVVEDSENMFFNRGDAVSSRYGFDQRQVLYNWWTALKSMEKALNAQKAFKPAKAVAFTVKKAVEPAFNFYGIEPQNIKDRIGVVLFSLVFYVAYTLWYGFAVMYMFEGWGMQLEH
ncbi:hypothetical protein D3OALGA1CA_2807 [Olavius algarvensis associated proteobacterium Delta 3]|nr:hypothetical protein D3OALGA1CA_2807 [Olavius algarvensis associated proteobacterium Delta 3]CAB5163917.1 hypothetical protein D3OALGB2SA_5616 [Olavius algarvensis associated proteobacterium Delta 3]